MASRKNPASGESMIVLLGVAVAGYFAYINNMFAGLGLPYTTTVPATGTTSATKAMAATTPVGSTASPTAAAVAQAPPLGTTVTSVAAAAAQAAANYPYIICDANTNASLQSTGLQGYSTIQTTDAGLVWLRSDVFNAVNVYNQNNITRLTTQYATAGTTPPASVLQNATNITLAGIKQVMQQQGLSGLGLINARSMFPYNPITGGMGILNAPPSWN